MSLALVAATATPAAPPTAVSTRTGINRLSDTVLIMILNLLVPKELMRARETCRWFNHTSQDVRFGYPVDIGHLITLERTFPGHRPKRTTPVISRVLHAVSRQIAHLKLAQPGVNGDTQYETGLQKQLAHIFQTRFPHLRELTWALPSDPNRGLFAVGPPTVSSRVIMLQRGCKDSDIPVRLFMPNLDQRYWEQLVVSSPLLTRLSIEADKHTPLGEMLDTLHKIRVLQAAPSCPQPPLESLALSLPYAISKLTMRFAEFEPVNFTKIDAITRQFAVTINSSSCDLAPLQSLTSLTSLRLQAKVRESVFAQIAGCQHLTALEMHRIGSTIPPIPFTTMFQSLTRLRSLSLNEYHGSDYNFFTHTQFTSITLNNCEGFRRESIPHLASCASLRVLKIRDTPMILLSELLDLVNACPKLTHVDISKTAKEEIGAERIIPFKFEGTPKAFKEYCSTHELMRTEELLAGFPWK